MYRLCFLGCLLAACLVMVLPVAALAGPAPAVIADPGSLAEALRLPEVLLEIASDSIQGGSDLDQTFLGGKGGASFQDEIAHIYDPDQMSALFLPVLQAQLAEDGTDQQELVRFFTSDLGRKVVALELSTRQSMLDKTTEAAAKSAYQDMLSADDPRLDLLRGFVSANNLLEMNVASALSSNLAFAKGIATQALKPGPSDKDLVAAVWADEDEVRKFSEVWLMSYLALAYAPLSDAELQAFTDFSASRAGLGLNRALYIAFDATYAQLSHAAGQAVGRRMASTEL